MITGENDNRIFSLTAFIQCLEYLASHLVNETDGRVIRTNQSLLLLQIHLQVLRGASVTSIHGNVIPVPRHFWW